MEYKNYQRCNGLHLGDKSQNRKLVVWKLSTDIHFKIYKMYNSMLVNTIKLIYFSMQKKKTYWMTAVNWSLVKM